VSAEDDRDKTKLPWDVGASEGLFALFLMVLIPYLALCVALVAASLVFYPIAWVLGFKPRRWWVSADGLSWSRALGNTFWAVLVLAALLSSAIVFLTRYH